MGTPIRNYLLLHLTVFIYGFTGILGKLISIPAVHLVWYRILIAFISLYLFNLFRGNASLKYDLKNIARFGATGVVIALHWVFFYQSIKVAPVSVAVVCLSSSTFFTALIEPVFYHRRIKLYQLLLGGVIMLSIYLIFNLNRGYGDGLVYGLISAFLASVFPVLNGLLGKKHDAGIITLYEFLGGILVLTIYLFVQEQFNTGFFILPPSDWLWLALLGIVCTAFTFVISIQIMRYITPYTVVLSINLEPVYTIILAIILLNEGKVLSGSFYAGTLLILAAIFYNAYRASRERNRDESRHELMT